ncbi:MAG: hypothetical protein JRE45_18635 [Deltaproteobacteria bacterium]|nr:hypothetical protein [Deltaproteobacteria bacterium]MBW2159765.1 hypothetical protein [Deltaproteobacteria bacterium]MBW2378352.1 hypothetical protein [Deltaproteobacteria bacterium]MBW2585863.1 hypothetical protein [Deltaproteobacteria bacterium]MBW2629614.1 hypothetical protein [Deltaproteobacteria bacterium]
MKQLPRFTEWLRNERPLRYLRRAAYLAPPLALVVSLLVFVSSLADRRLESTLVVGEEAEQWLADYFFAALVDERPAAAAPQPQPQVLNETDLLLATLYLSGEKPRYYVHAEPLLKEALGNLSDKIRSGLGSTAGSAFLKVEIRTSELKRLTAESKDLIQYLVDDAAEGFKIDSESDGTRFVFPTEAMENDWDLFKTLASARRSGAEVFRFLTHAVVLDLRRRTWMRATRNQPEPEAVTSGRVKEAIISGADFLVRHQEKDGRYRYAYDPIGDKYPQGYNLLRHVGTSFSLYQIYGLTRDAKYLAAADRAMAWLDEKHVKTDGEISFVLEGWQAKLGGGGLALLALCEREKWVKDGRDLELMLRFGRFIERVQKPNGDFQHYFRWSEQADVPARGSIYYPGEATLALIRLHRVTGERRWLESASKAADFMIGRWRFLGLNTYVPPDAWLMYALSDIYEVTGKARYLEYNRVIAETMWNYRFREKENRASAFVGSTWDPQFPRSTPTAARSEGQGALCRALKKMEHEAEASLCAKELLAATAFLLSQQITERNSFYAKAPEKAVGGFFSSIVDPEIRIDYVQHNISALLFALDWLE